MTLKQALITAGIGLVVLVGIALAFTLTKRSYEAQILKLQNDVAARDVTIETQQGVYQKLALTSNNLQSLLDSKDVQLQELTTQLEKSGAQLLTANTINFQLRKQLEATGSAVVVTKPPTIANDTGDTDVTLTASADQGPFHADCAMSFLGKVDGKVGYKLDLSQPKPIRLSVVVSQNKDGSWGSATTSSSEDFKVDIALAAVNPYVLEEKWYEKIAFDVEAGVGTNPGLLAGVGVSYQIGKFDIGPKVWAVVDHGASPYFGASLAWHPFKK